VRFSILEKGSFGFRNPFWENDLTVEIGSYKRRWVVMHLWGHFRNTISTISSLHYAWCFWTPDVRKNFFTNLI